LRGKRGTRESSSLDRSEEARGQCLYMGISGQIYKGKKDVEKADASTELRNGNPVMTIAGDRKTFHGGERKNCHSPQLLPGTL